MAVLYKSFQSVLEDKNHKKMFHPRVIYTANISTSQIAKEIAAYSSRHPPLYFVLRKRGLYPRS